MPNRTHRTRPYRATGQDSPLLTAEELEAAYRHIDLPEAALPGRWTAVAPDSAAVSPVSFSAQVAELERITRSFRQERISFTTDTVTYAPPDFSFYRTYSMEPYSWNSEPMRTPHFSEGDVVIVRRRGSLFCANIQSWSVNGLGHVVYRVTPRRYSAEDGIDIFSVVATDVIGGACLDCGSAYDLTHAADGNTFCNGCSTKQIRKMINA